MLVTRIKMKNGGALYQRHFSFSYLIPSLSPPVDQLADCHPTLRPPAIARRSSRAPLGRLPHSTRPHPYRLHRFHPPQILATTARIASLVPTTWEAHRGRLWTGGSAVRPMPAWRSSEPPLFYTFICIAAHMDGQRHGRICATALEGDMPGCACAICCGRRPAGYATKVTERTKVAKEVSTLASVMRKAAMK